MVLTGRAHREHPQRKVGKLRVEVSQDYLPCYYLEILIHSIPGCEQGAILVLDLTNLDPPLLLELEQCAQHDISRT